ncbi:MAG: hypothetical protein V1724_08920 [Chloroflexota bacterium]
MPVLIFQRNKHGLVLRSLPSYDQPGNRYLRSIRHLQPTRGLQYHHVYPLLLQRTDEVCHASLIRRHPPGLARAVDGNVQPVLGNIDPCVPQLFLHLSLLSGPSLRMMRAPGPGNCSGSVRRGRGGHAEFQPCSTQGSTACPAQ